ncbi:hypothetical protein OPU71_02980 [Niveibacterium sp. 24ML]|uniref:hypothetical protein n=1 Tax=Niveibacterium sp. 24ML TaxID=2985512 RepID=UPI002270E4F1|nr:hypothetical protein [Niveibacterium sp. 24ML]MCX9155083.1 hypothetical protein [Niveibacterium sp. 24ML]
MAASLKPWFGLAFGLCAMAALAAPGDPTRPPDAYLPAAMPAAGAPSAEAMVLQSVLIGPDRKLAVISGQTVLLGGRIGEARLVAMSEKSATIEDASGRRVLPLVATMKQTPAAVGTKPGMARRGGE